MSRKKNRAQSNKPSQPKITTDPEKIQPPAAVTAPWYQIYAKPIAALMAGTGVIMAMAAGFLKPEKHEIVAKPREAAVASPHPADSRQAAERNSFGNLYAIKDQIPEAMLNKNPQTGVYDSEIMLSQLERRNNKFVLKVYMGEPPANSGFALSELTPEFKQQVSKGLAAWGEILEIVPAERREDANVCIYSNQSLPAALNAVTTLKDGYNPSLAHLKERLYSLGNNILINPRFPDYQQEATNALANDIVHETGHLLGLAHTDVVIGFTINHGQGYGGYTDIYKIPPQVMYDFSLASPKLYPELSGKTVMMRFRQIDPHDPNQFQTPGELDIAAVKLAIEKFNAKYGPDYQPPKKQQLEAETSKWRDQETANSLNGSRGR